MGGTSVQLSSVLDANSHKVINLTPGTTTGDAISFGQSFTANTITFSPTTAGIVGTTTNNNTVAGNIGEYVESVFSNVAAGATGVIIDATSISLTAGDWDVTLNILASENTGSGTSTTWSTGISQTSGNSITGLVLGSNYAASMSGFAGATNNGFNCIAAYRQSLSGTTTIYAKAVINYPSGTWGWFGRLSARRMR